MKPKRRSEPVTLKFISEQVETPKAYLLVLDTGEEAWFPKSQIKSINWDTGELQIPRWLAEETNLLGPSPDPDAPTLQ